MAGITVNGVTYKDANELAMAVVAMQAERDKALAAADEAKAIAAAAASRRGPSIGNMEGVEHKLDGHVLTLVIDLSQRLGTSKSGKSETIATTRGNIPIFSFPNGERAFLSLNSYAK